MQLQPRTSDLSVPNPLSIDFGGKIELVGYSLSDLTPNAGDSMTLTLYWRALQPISEDYVVFAHVVDPLTTTLYAGSDAMPANWNAPTSTWQPGVVIEDAHTLDLSAETPPGIYEVEFGLYLNPGDGTFPGCASSRPMAAWRTIMPISAACACCRVYNRKQQVTSGVDHGSVPD